MLHAHIPLSSYENEQNRSAWKTLLCLGSRVVFQLMYSHASENKAEIRLPIYVNLLPLAKVFRNLTFHNIFAVMKHKELHNLVIKLYPTVWTSYIKCDAHCHPKIRKSKVVKIWKKDCWSKSNKNPFVLCPCSGQSKHVEESLLLTFGL